MEDLDCSRTSFKFFRRTKHLAKIGSQVAKPDGLIVVEPDRELEFLHDLPVELMWGVGPVTARNANVYICEDLVGPRSIRIGDAAHGLDPLSGHGQFQAVSTALNAVAVVATLFDRPSQADLAKRFYAERVEQAFLTQARVGRDFYRLRRFKSQ